MTRTALLFASCLAALASPAPAQNSSTNGTLVSNDAASVSVTPLTDSVLRVRVMKAGSQTPEDASWAVSSAVRGKSVKVRLVPSGFQTGSLSVGIDPATLRLTVADLEGRTIVDDVAGAMSFEGSRFTLRKAMPTGEQYYGLGDKTGPFNRRGASYVNWTTDAWGFDRGTDPIYKSIPFYIASGGPGGAYGLFLDNTWRSSFDFGHRDDGMLAISADGGPIDYYIIAGPTVADVVRRYTDLTGKAPLPPRWDTTTRTGQLRVCATSNTHWRTPVSAPQ
jgi:alpha-glucosidase